MKKYKLGDLGDIVGGSTPSTKDINNYGGSISWITPKDLSDFKGIYISKGERNITEKGFKSCSTKMLPKNSVLFTSRAPIGYIAISQNELCTNQGFKSIIPNKKIYYLYLYYLLKYKKNYIENFGIGTTFKEISATVMKNIEVEILESIEEQKKIAKILYTIDKKIELNRHTNNNLYKTFRSIYKNTFLNKTTNTIKFSDFNEIGNLVMGQSPKGSSYNEEKIGLPLINGAADYKDGMLNPNKYTSEPTRVCNAKDLVFCIRATIGQLTIADQEYCLGRGVACISNINELYYEYVFNIIEESIDKLKAVATGSVILGLSKDDINNLEVYKPTLEEIEKFHKLEQPILNRIIEIKKQNKTLEQIRDTLLPKLMNGEIDLDKIEI